MDRDYEAIAAKLANLDANPDWRSAAREIHEAVVQILQGMNELQQRIITLEGENAESPLAPDVAPPKARHGVL